MLKRNITLHFMLAFSFVSIHAKEFTYCYKHYCVCSHQGGNAEAICSGRELTYIPRLPNYITGIIMDHTNLSGIRENMFHNLTIPERKLPIIKINLTGNMIDYLDVNAFSNLTRLVVFVISRETSLDIKVLRNSLTSLKSTRLKHVEITYNSWNKFPTNMFDFLLRCELRMLNLDGNNLHLIDCNMFTHLKYLRILHISNNLIKNFKLCSLYNLTTLLLDGNILPTVPRFCDNTGNSFVPHLQHLDLSRNGIGFIGEKSFSCLPNVRTLSLAAIKVAKLENNIFSNMPSLSSLQLAGTILKSIESFAFNSSTITTLSLGSCRFHFDDNEYNPATIFAYSPKLQNLDLTRNSLYLRRNYNNIICMFRTLTNLRWLSLESTWLSELPRYVFTKLNRLETLVLKRNQIKTWNNSEDIFGNMTSLRHLNLELNSIAVINKTSFPKDLLTSLQSLYLSNNPFSCTCEQMWFLEWLKSTKTDLGTYPKFYTCAHPSSMKGVRLKDYHPTIKICNPWNSVIFITSSSSALLVLVTITSLIAIKCQPNIKNYIYYLRLYQKRKNGYVSLDCDTDYEYHAFVVYCDADMTWVHNQLLDKIENSEGMQLCIHHRNFDAGEAITENVDKYLRQSWKVIVVMSNFCKSEWCQWEIDVVQERRRQQGRMSVIPIMLENIDTKHMSGKVRTLLDTTPYITYRKGVGADLFWNTLIESLRTPLGHPPVSLI